MRRDQVLYRYELTYYNPTALVIDLPDDLLQRMNSWGGPEDIQTLSFERTGETLTLDGIALRNKSGSPEKFAEAAERLGEWDIPPTVQLQP